MLNIAGFLSSLGSSPRSETVAAEFAARWNNGSVPIPEALLRHVRRPDGTAATVWPWIVDCRQITPCYCVLRFAVSPGVMTVRELAEHLDVVESVVEWPIDGWQPVYGNPNALDVWFGYPPDFTDITETPQHAALYPSAPCWSPYIGWTAYDAAVNLPLENRAGVLVSGMPGCGKTALMVRVAAELLLSGAMIGLIDFKGGGDYRSIAPWCRMTATDLDGALGILDAADNELRRRVKELTAAGEANYWRWPAEARPPLLVLIVDEVQEGCVAFDKREKDKAAEFARRLTSVVKRGRSAGVAVIVGSQKVTSDALPTGLRDVLEVRVCGRQLSAEAARAAMGVLPDDGPRPDRLPAGVPGRMVLAGAGDPFVFQAAPPQSAQTITDALYGVLGAPPVWPEAAEA